MSNTGNKITDWLPSTKLRLLFGESVDFEKLLKTIIMKAERMFATQTRDQIDEIREFQGCAFTIIVIQIPPIIS